MKIEGEAKIIFEYETEKEAEDIANLLEIDNKAAPKDLAIKTFPEGEKVITEIKSRDFKKLFSTLDDLIFSERIINEILKI